MALEQVNSEGLRFSWRTAQQLNKYVPLSGELIDIVRSTRLVVKSSIVIGENPSVTLGAQGPLGGERTLSLITEGSDPRTMNNRKAELITEPLTVDLNLEDLDGAIAQLASVISDRILAVSQFKAYWTQVQGRPVRGYNKATSFYQMAKVTHNDPVSHFIWQQLLTRHVKTSYPGILRSVA